jgi:hypothetical protein
VPKNVVPRHWQWIEKLKSGKSAAFPIREIRSSTPSRFFGLTLFNYYAYISTMRCKGRGVIPGIRLITKFSSQKALSLPQKLRQTLLPRRPGLNSFNTEGRRPVALSLPRRNALRESGSHPIKPSRVIFKEPYFAQN